MSQWNCRGWQPVATRILLGGVVLWQLTAIGFAEEKSPKHRGAPPRQTDQAKRVEPKPTGRAIAIDRFSTAENPRTNPKFQPNFSREPAKVHLQPTNAGASQLAFLPEKGDKGNKGGNAQRSSTTDKPVRIDTIPKIEPTKPRDHSNPPHVQPQLKIKIEDRTNSGRPNNPQGNPINGAVDSERDGKIRIHTIQPDLKVSNSPNKNDKSPGEKPVRLKAGETLPREHHEQ
ncbi:MAG: hypothetical protein JWN70_526, partial [Planctomycetaceae bacterium]|nr:hypothetical protein [Planctomycetaceae bacterium]